MNVKVHYRITQDRAGLPQNFSGARRFPSMDMSSLIELAKTELAADYQIPPCAIEISMIED